MAETDVVAEYSASLHDLTFNSKPHISMLTMLADESRDQATEIVRVIEKRLREVPHSQKLPLLYLLDSICKNVNQGPYQQLFTQNIVSNFCHVFEKADEKTRLSLYKLRQTWKDIFPESKLIALDKRVQSEFDPQWPVPKPNSSAKAAQLKPTPPAPVASKATTPPQSSPPVEADKPQRAAPQVHFNPKFINKSTKRLNQELDKRRKGPAIVPAQPLPPAPTSTTKGNRREPKSAVAQPEVIGRRRIAHQPKRARSPSPPKALHHKQEQPDRPKKTNEPKRQNQTKPRKAQKGGQPAAAPAGSKPKSMIANPLSARRQPQQQPASHPQKRPRSQSPKIRSVINKKLDTGIERLDMPRPNDTMLVDGKLRKLFHLDDSISIILMDAPIDASFGELIQMDPLLLNPRIISFEGLPTKVFIDNNPNEFVILEFNNRPVTFFHNNNPQQVKFGSPGKEIVFNGRAIQAKFGGPAIDVTFYGDEQVLRHTLRLDGPPPRVKISEEPRYDLWKRLVLQETLQEAAHPPSRMPMPISQPQMLPPMQASLMANAGFGSQQSMDFMPTINPLQTLGPLPLGQPSAPQPLMAPMAMQSMVPQAPMSVPPFMPVAPVVAQPAPQPPPSNVSDLLAKLVTYGIIKTEADKPKQIEPVEQKAPARNSPPESKALSSKQLPPLELTPESLKIPRPLLSASLYEGVQCTNCSLRFVTKNKSNTKYSEHLDWHFRQKRKELKPKSAQLKRQWYYRFDDWLQFKAVSDETDAKDSLPMDETSRDGSKTPEECLVRASVNQEENICTVCGEPFDTVYNEEEEEWMLKNAIEHEGKFCHPICVNDLQIVLTADSVPTDATPTDPTDTLPIEPPESAAADSLPTDPSAEPLPTDAIPSDPSPTLAETAAADDLAPTDVPDNPLPTDPVTSDTDPTNTVLSENVNCGRSKKDEETIESCLCVLQ